MKTVKNGEFFVKLHKYAKPNSKDLDEYIKWVFVQEKSSV